MDEWSRKFLEFINVLSQMSQTNGLTSLCWLTWYLSWWLCLNALPHSAQINGLVSSSSSLLSCAIFSCVQVQNLHTNTFLSLVDVSTYLKKCSYVTELFILKLGLKLYVNIKIEFRCKLVCHPVSPLLSPSPLTQC